MAQVLRMPLLSDTMTEGTIVAWHKKVGDYVEVGDLLVEIETDKAVMEQESFYEGYLLYIGVQESETVPVDAVLAVIGEKNEDYKAAIASDGGLETTEKTVEVVETVVEQVLATESSGERIKASPLARKMAKEAAINLATIRGTGENGRIVKRDILAYLEAKPVVATPPVVKPVAPPVVAPPPTVVSPPPPPPPAPMGMLEETYEEVKLSQMRKTIARRLGESKYSAPHFYLTISVNMDAVIPARKRMNTISPSKISFNDIIVKAAAVALKQHPAINASWLGDKIRYNKVYNIGVAVAVEEGLLVPVINHVNLKSLSEIAAEIKEKAKKAQGRRLSIEEMSGNTFTISNLGMFGIEEFTAIINPPASCILAVGAIVPTPVVIDGEIKIASKMKLTLSCDHRVVDGATGAKYLQTLKQILEDPIRLLV